MCTRTKNRKAKRQPTVGRSRQENPLLLLLLLLLFFALAYCLQHLSDGGKKYIDDDQVLRELQFALDDDGR